jgi:hypothetical protein
MGIAVELIESLRHESVDVPEKNEIPPKAIAAILYRGLIEFPQNKSPFISIVFCCPGKVLRNKAQAGTQRKSETTF